MSEPASGGGLNGDNDEATSEQLSNAWRVVGKRLLAEGYDPALVTETMLTVALKSWVGLRTRPDAVRRLRSLADQLEQDQDLRKPPVRTAGQIGLVFPGRFQCPGLPDRCRRSRRLSDRSCRRAIRSF